MWQGRWARCLFTEEARQVKGEGGVQVTTRVRVRVSVCVCARLSVCVCVRERVCALSRPWPAELNEVMSHDRSGGAVDFAFTHAACCACPRVSATSRR